MAIKGSFLQDQADKAPEAGFSPVNYGKLTVTPMVVAFGTGEDKHAPPTRVAMRDGQELKKNENLELNIVVNISELNPNLQFEYERGVMIRKSSARLKTDWTEIVLPSLVTVFGEQWADAILKSPYVEVEDTPNVNGTTSKSGKLLSVPKFLKAFKSKAECVAAREKRFGSAAVTSGSSSGDVPGEVIEQVKGLIKSVGESKAQEMLAAYPFGKYEPDELITLAQA